MIVGDFASDMDLKTGQPFSGTFGAGDCLSKLLHEAGIERTSCFITHLSDLRTPYDLTELMDPRKTKPPLHPSYVQWKGHWVHPQIVRDYEQLLARIKLVRPALIICMGNAPLVALAGKKGIKTWRGSMLRTVLPDNLGFQCKLIPVYHPANVLRDWSTRAITVHDLRRCAKEALTTEYNVPNYNFVIRPNFAQACKFFADLRMKLQRGVVECSTDIETRAGHIACTGFAFNTREAFCIPWMCVERPDGYWSADEELYLWRQCNYCMTHPNFKIIGQNWLYDSQYKYRFHFKKTYPYWDTMIAHHCMFPGTPKGLDYLASIHCEYYVYWKDDGKNWDPKVGEDQLWTYNCEDCVRTFEVYLSQKPAVERDKRLAGVWDFQTNTLAPLLFRAMLRGIRADTLNKARLSAELGNELAIREKWIQDATGHALNIRSPKQMVDFFYVDLKQKEIHSRKSKTKGLTTDDDALETIAKREPVLIPLVRRIREVRSLGVFKSTFVEARLDRDNRIRCSFNVAGTDTFRLSSSENAFGSGLNLQNIPAGNEDEDLDTNALILPNIRKLFIPDPGYEMFDMDLDRADLQVVVWEADDEELRRALELGVDLHLLNAGTIFGIKELNSMNLLDPEFLKYAKGKYVKQRKFCKAWVHGTNYGGGDRTMAATVGITVRENERYREKWFGDHPGIKGWHDRTELQLNSRRYVENRFGYRFTFFDRVEGLLPEALAWVPQSTVGCVINRAWDQITKQISDVEVLIQVHDSLVGQYPVELHDEMVKRIPEAARVVVPYDKPLIIPVGLKTSPVSWGHCA